MQCPACSSKNIQRQRLVYEAGTSDGVATSEGKTSPNLFSPRNPLDTFTTKTKTKTTTQTPLAAKCSPPSPPIFIDFLLLISGPFLILAVLLSLGTFLIPSIGFLVWWFMRRQPRYKQELKNYKETLNIYEESWICHQCGHMWSSLPNNNSLNENVGDKNILIQLQEELVEKRKILTRIKQAYGSACNSASEWENRVQIASEKGDDNLASEALARQQKFENHASELKIQIDACRRKIDEVELNVMEEQRKVFSESLTENSSKNIAERDVVRMPKRDIERFLHEFVKVLFR